MGTQTPTGHHKNKLSWVDLPWKHRLKVLCQRDTGVDMGVDPFAPPSSYRKGHICFEGRRRNKVNFASPECKRVLEHLSKAAG